MIQLRIDVSENGHFSSRGFQQREGEALFSVLDICPNQALPGGTATNISKPALRKGRDVVCSEETEDEARQSPHIP